MLSVQLCTQMRAEVGYRAGTLGKRGRAMLTQRETTTTAGERPFNNLLRRLNDADYALLALYLTQDEAVAGDLLYNPGDDVKTVYFPCGPSLVSYMVPNEDGRNVETI